MKQPVPLPNYYKGTPSVRALNRAAWGKLAIFSQYLVIAWKQYKIDPWLLWTLIGSHRYPIDPCKVPVILKGWTQMESDSSGRCNYVWYRLT